MFQRVLLVLAALPVFSAALHSPWIRLHSIVNPQHYNAVASKRVQYDDVDTLTWNPPVDHFDAQNTNTFKQRYFVNEQFWIRGNKQGPVFICVGGEGPPLASDVLTNSVHCSDMVELGAKKGALLLALEHRFYGPSVPTPDFSNENLKFLSAHQALADLAAFRMFISEKYNLDDKIHKWVSWGGSYPGMLAGWFRLKFPNLVHAAVSSSAPVHAQVDFQGYDDVVAQSMRASIVGGSDKCADIIKVGHAEIGKLLQSTEGRESLAAKFNICEGADGLVDANNQADWAGNGVIYLPAQENDPSCDQELCNIQKICSFLESLNESAPIDSLARVSAKQFGSQCTSVNHSAYLDSLLNITVAGGVGRIWLYQTCSEFAFYQTCEVGSECIYTQGLNTVDKQLAICEEVFGIPESQVAARVEFSNLYWGSLRPSGSRVLYVNGEIDPWHYLSILETPDPVNLPALWVPGASHHFWTHPSLPTDTKFIQDARVRIWETVDKWLSEETA